MGRLVLLTKLKSVQPFKSYSQNRSACGGFLSKFQPLKVEKLQLFIKPSIFKTSHWATATVLTFLETSCHGDSGAHLEFKDIWPEAGDIRRQS